MCDFILKLAERRKNKSMTSPVSENTLDISSNDSITNNTVDVQESIVDDKGIKDKSKLFSKFFEKGTQGTSKNVSRIFGGTGIPESVRNGYDNSSSDMSDNQDTSYDELVSNVLKEEKFYGIDKSSDESPELKILETDESIEVLNIKEEQSPKEVNKENRINELYNEMMSIAQLLEDNYKSFATCYNEMTALIKPVQDVNVPEEVITKTDPVNKNEDVLFNKISNMVSRLSEKSHQLQAINNKLDSLYKNESFTYSKPSEVKEKIKIFGKNFYEVFKTIQFDLNKPVRKEYISLIEFSKNTSDYVLFRTKVKSLAESYNSYLSRLNIKLNDMITDSGK